MPWGGPRGLIGVGFPFVLFALALRVSTPLGVAEGVWEGPAFAFYGLPYAEAARFAPPRAAGPWPRGVGREKIACPQAFSITAAFGSPIPKEREDCLVLNVFLPQALPPPGGFPVMVYLHGGGFGSGSGAEPLYGGHHLAAQGVVVVVPNYRLGPLGFLALPALAREDPEAVGNYALLDLLEALRFVQRYIRYFGGNPDNVTLFGESAGGMLVCTLLATPKAQGLFHRAILQSGGCGYVRSLKEDFPKGEAWAKARGCDPADLACLRALPLERIFPKPRPLSLPDLDLGGRIASFLESPFKPHLSPLLPEDPRAVLARGGAAGIPLIAGANLEELDLPGLRAFWGPRSWEEFRARLEAEFPKGTAQALLEGYRARFSNPALAYGALETDRILLCPSLKAARLQAPHAPTYAYLFTYRAPGFEGLGAFHGLELAPLFGHLHVPPFLPLFLTQEAYQSAKGLGERMRGYWTAFAREGEPRGWPRWPPYGKGYVLRLDDPIGLLPDPYEERCGLWERLGLL